MSSEYLKEGSKKNPNFQTVYPLPLKQQENVNYSHKEVIYKYISHCSRAFSKLIFEIDTKISIFN